jgi:hypothetical protein
MIPGNITMQTGTQVVPDIVVGSALFDPLYVASRPSGMSPFKSCRASHLNNGVFSNT